MNIVFEELRDSITGITKENMDAFEKLLDPDVFEEISVGKSFGIGVVQEGTAVGAAAYNFDVDPLDGGMILRLNYLLIHPEYRLYGLGDMLMTAIIAVAEDAGADTIAVLFPSESEDLRGSLEGWEFELEDGISPEIAISLKDVMDHKQIMENCRNVKPLAEENPGDFGTIVKGCLAAWGYKGFLSGPVLLSDYLDLDLSCYMGSLQSPQALLLAHYTPKGKVAVEFLGSNDPDSEDEIKLLSFLCVEAMRKYKKNTFVTIKPDTMEFILNLDADKLFKKHLILSMTEGILFLLIVRIKR